MRARNGLTAGALFLIAALVGFSAGRKARSGVTPPDTGVASRAWNHGSKRIAYVLPNEGPYYDLKWAGAQAELLRLGYEPQKYTAGGYKNIKAQLDIMDDLIQKKVGGIILHAVDQAALAAAGDRAAAAGIPVIAENVAAGTASVAGSVQLANYQNGYELAMSLVNAIGGKGKIAALVGPPGLEASDSMWQGAKDYFAHWPGVEIVRVEYLQANAPDALTRTEAILAAHEDLAGIYTWFVQNGIGAAQALKARGYRPGQVAIVAKDIDSQGEQLLRDGWISALLVGEPVTMGRTSARLIDGLVSGSKIQTSVLLHNELVTARTIDHIDRTGFEVQRKDKP